MTVTVRNCRIPIRLSTVVVSHMSHMHPPTKVVESASLQKTERKSVRDHIRRGQKLEGSNVRSKPDDLILIENNSPIISFVCRLTRSYSKKVYFIVIPSIQIAKEFYFDLLFLD